MQRFLQFRLASHKLPIVVGRMTCMTDRRAAGPELKLKPYSDLVDLDLSTNIQKSSSLCQRHILDSETQATPGSCTDTVY